MEGMTMMDKEKKILTGRREFIRAFAATGALAAGGCTALKGVIGGRDENLTAFLSDIHIAGPDECKWGKQPDYQNPLLDRVIDQILAMRPQPARVVVFGDVALWFGFRNDCEIAAAKLKRLEAAGIPVYVTTGNHDHRETLFAAFPKQKEITKVPGRFCTKIDLGGADLLLFDSLDENPEGPGSGNAVAGKLEAAQYEWLLAEAKAATRPFLMGSHHPPRELIVKGQKRNFLMNFQGLKHFAGYIYGHNHKWETGWFHKDYGDPHIVRQLGLPSTGWWGTIGFSLARTYPDRIEVSLAPGNDFFFPSPLKAGEPRPAQWDEIVREETGAKCVFTPVL